MAETLPQPMSVIHYIGLRDMTGVETFVVSLASAQRKLGIDAAITCHPSGRGRLFALAAERGVPVLPFIVPASSTTVGFRRKWERLGLMLARVQSLAARLRSAPYAVIHIHPVGFGCLPAYVAAILSRRTRGVVVTHHTTLSFNSAPKGLRARTTFGLERHTADLITMPYAAAAAEVCAVGVAPHKVAMIPFCVELEKFTYAERTTNLEGTFNLLMSARLIAGKGHSELIAAMQQLVAAGKDVHLTIAGDGPKLSSIAHMVQTKGLNAHITLARQVEHRDIPKLLGRMDAVVLPSYMPGETFPISLLEAAAMGVPAVGTRWFGIPAIIVDGETGLLVDHKDVDDLTRALQSLIDDRLNAKRLGNNARARAALVYSATVIANTYLNHYNRIIGLKKCT